MKYPPRKVSKKCVKCAYIKEMACNQFQCYECCIKPCVVCGKSFYVVPSNIVRKCCSITCKDVLQKGRKQTPEQKLNHKAAVHRYFLKQREEGLRKCTVCKEGKKESLFAHKTTLKNTGTCKKCKGVSDHKNYFKYHDDRIATYQSLMKNPINRARQRKINRVATAKLRAGIVRDEIIKSDTRCYVCGITNEEHIKKVVKKNGQGISLSIHHIDNQGRRAMRMGFRPNNSPRNLMILCSADHRRQHNYERDYTGNGYKIWETRRKNLQRVI